MMPYNQKYCSGCSHYRSFNGSMSSANMLGCHYILDTDVPRDCPPGKGCKYYTTEPIKIKNFDPICLDDELYKDKQIEYIWGKTNEI